MSASTIGVTGLDNIIPGLRDKFGAIGDETGEGIDEDGDIKAVIDEGF